MGDRQPVLFPGELPLAPLSLGAVSLSVPILGDRTERGRLAATVPLTLPELWASVRAVEQPRAAGQPLSLLQTVVGRAASPPHPCLASLDSPAQKLVFNRVNGKRPQVLPQQVSAPEECYTLAHEENVRFIYEGEGRGSLGAGTRSLSHPRGARVCGVPPEAATSCWGPRWQGWGPQPGYLPSLVPAPGPLPQPPARGWKSPIPKPSTACSPPQPGSRYSSSWTAAGAGRAPAAPCST